MENNKTTAKLKVADTVIVRAMATGTPTEGEIIKIDRRRHDCYFVKIDGFQFPQWRFEWELTKG